jgi:membrane fusion protein (multidrug efflux system)
LFVVGPGNKALQRDVTAERSSGSNWVVTAGLNSGDRVIVQGLANVKPGAPVKPVSATTPQRIAPPKPGEAPAGSERKGR